MDLLKNVCNCISHVARIFVWKGGGGGGGELSPRIIFQVILLFCTVAHSLA